MIFVLSRKGIDRGGKKKKKEPCVETALVP